MFVSSTPIAMSNRTESTISEVSPGDLVISVAGNDSEVYVVDNQHYDGTMIRVCYQDQGVVCATPDQLFVTERGPVPASSLLPGDRLETPFYGAGWLILWDVESVEHYQYQGEVYGLRIVGDGRGTYCAGDVLVQEDSTIPR